MISVLSRSKEEGVGIEDLDKLQTELELMLSNVVLRQRTLHTEISHISAAEETKLKKTASLSIAKIVNIHLSSFYLIVDITFYFSPFRKDLENTKTELIRITPIPITKIKTLPKTTMEIP